MLMQLYYESQFSIKPKTPLLDSFWPVLARKPQNKIFPKTSNQINFKTLRCCNLILKITQIPHFPFHTKVSLYSNTFNTFHIIPLAAEYFNVLKSKRILILSRFKAKNKYAKTASTTLLLFTFVIDFENICHYDVFCLFVLSSICLLFTGLITIII